MRGVGLCGVSEVRAMRDAADAGIGITRAAQAVADHAVVGVIGCASVVDGDPGELRQEPGGVHAFGAAHAIAQKDFRSGALAGDEPDRDWGRTRMPTTQSWCTRLRRGVQIESGDAQASGKRPR
jgi:hypothetical protein